MPSGVAELKAATGGATVAVDSASASGAGTYGPANEPAVAAAEEPAVASGTLPRGATGTAGPGVSIPGAPEGVASQNS
ncbi:hypothetical protein [Mycobacteroides abscessus]|uniref:hypothetical protein n=1 Tax=Mycobacteroides abscessus TaxID=36809 RepID=UPI000D90ABCD|nr:hypothetical protein [Mycobacteroides abscessus]SPX87863.1 Uncharacterised protein [Mycobacteroides abscessus]